MRALTTEQMKKLDEYAADKLGLHRLILMENAAAGVVEEILKDVGNVYGKNVVVFAGKGNNGGDAFAVARHLHVRGANVLVIIIGSKSGISGDALTNLNILSNMDVKIAEIVDDSQIDWVISSLYVSDIVVDGIFGIGLKREIEGFLNDIIEIINNSGRYVVSIDVPSGLDGTTGKVMGSCIRADKTVTFSYLKTGMLGMPGISYCGNIVVKNIGIPENHDVLEGNEVHLIDTNMISDMFVKRDADTNKADYGKVFIVAGSPGMTGAGVMCASAAMRTGSGLVYAGVPRTIAAETGSKLLEPICIPLEDKGRGFICRESLADINSRIEMVDSIAIGPGLSTEDCIGEVIEEILKKSKVPVVIDADALNVIAKNKSVLKNISCPVIVTPHPGEMARLMDTTPEEIQNNRIEAAKSFSKKWGIITVLKGYRTVISDEKGAIYINPTGNPGMATAGSGDVLTGMIAAMLGRKLKPIDAAILAVYTHGLAGDIAVILKGENGMIASDIIQAIPEAILRIEGVMRK